MTQYLDFKKVAESGPQTVSASIVLTPEDLERDEIATISPVRVEVGVDEGDRPREFVVTGSVAFEADLTCSRCIEPYPFAVHSDFTLRYLPRPEGVGAVEGEEIEIAPEQLDEEYYGEPQVELRPIVLEQVQLSIPMKPLCEEGCLGLCPTCGANRNRAECECAAEESDHRWDALRGIREQLAKKKEI
jgi:uncharacterized metal-binding protein YceD (DUF177 family)